MTKQKTPSKSDVFRRPDLVGKQYIPFFERVITILEANDIDAFMSEVVKHEEHNEVFFRRIIPWAEGGSYCHNRAYLERTGMPALIRWNTKSLPYGLEDVRAFYEKRSFVKEIRHEDLPIIKRALSLIEQEDEETFEEEFVKPYEKRKLLFFTWMPDQSLVVPLQDYCNFGITGDTFLRHVRWIIKKVEELEAQANSHSAASEG